MWLVLPLHLSIIDRLCDWIFLLFESTLNYWEKADFAPYFVMRFCHSKTYPYRSIKHFHFWEYITIDHFIRQSRLPISDRPMVWHVQARIIYCRIFARRNYYMTELIDLIRYLKIEYLNMIRHSSYNGWRIIFCM